LVLKKRCQFRIHQVVVPWHICKSFLKIRKVENTKFTENLLF
jgi:hypothetical protein